MLDKLRGLGLEVMIRFNVSFQSFLWKLLKICFTIEAFKFIYSGIFIRLQCTRHCAKYWKYNGKEAR